MRRRWAGVALAILLTACTGKTQTMGGSWAGRPTAPENFRREFQLRIEFNTEDGDATSSQVAPSPMADRPQSSTRASSPSSSH
ncbi:MAG: hypothetical protein ACREJA_04200 [Candidatus Methylomirabilales bacterium]